MDKTKFFDSYRTSFGKLKQEQVPAIEFLLDRFSTENDLPLEYAAYILATVKHETADTFEPVREAYWTSEEWRKGHLRYWPWYGRGYVQLTWKQNYEKAGKELGKDLTTNPDVALEPAISADVLIRGMKEGWFTGKRLGSFISSGKVDYINARQIVNGMDRAELIAGYAESFEKALKAGGFGATPKSELPVRKVLVVRVDGKEILRITPAESVSVMWEQV